MDQRSSTQQVLHSYIELSRGSNLPTCFSNVLVGLATATVTLVWWHIPVAAFAVAMLYIAGMAMNGAIDVESDRIACPNRPIPSGRISIKNAYAFAIITALLGLGVLGATNQAAFGLGVLLTASIIFYNVTHKKFVSSVVFMGLCRGLVYATAAAVATPELFWRLKAGLPILAVTLAIYTAVITRIARHEHTSHLITYRWFLLAVPVVVLSAALWITPVGRLWPFVTAILVVAWFVRGIAALSIQPTGTQRAVMTWLSCICLVDAYFLSLLDRTGLSIIAVGCFGITVWAHRRISGT